MSEAVRNLVLLVWAVSAINTTAYAETQSGIMEEKTVETKAPVSAPTVVFGAAATPDGGEDAVLVEQPENAANPLGNPIPEQVAPQPVTEPNSNMPEDAVPAAAKDAGGPVFGQGSRVVAPGAAQKLGKDFQNTLMESNGMVYDIQAYPEADLPVIGNPANPETIYSPNVNP